MIKGFYCVLCERVWYLLRATSYLTEVIDCVLGLFGGIDVLFLAAKGDTTVSLHRTNG